jgi:genome maintenance exonuclease 1
MFKESVSLLDKNIDQVVLQEQAMYSDIFKVAGRCDFIGVWQNELAVVDFKTTTTMKKREWLDDYFNQCSAYASMYEEHTGEPIDQIVIFMVAEDGQIEIFREETKDYLPKLDEMMESFYDNLDTEELVA